VGVRAATAADWPAIWPIWHAVVAAGDTYVWLPSTTEADARELWMLPPPAAVYVLEDDDGVIAGTAKVVPNQAGLGDHIGNASFMVDPARHGEGLGRRLAEAVIAAAATDYEGMQFNAVVATNDRAVALWRSLGFEVIGSVPAAFRLASGGRADLLVMYRSL
jgi:L-amino acid N-acyltransferase YncA